MARARASPAYPAGRNGAVRDPAEDPLLQVDRFEQPAAAEQHLGAAEPRDSRR